MAFTDKTFRFLANLEANNEKDWFEANRERYEAHWKDAALDVIATLSDGMSRLDPPLRAVPKLNRSLRRINRDVRFSKDKTPYTARLHMIFWAGDHPNRSAAMHVVLTPTGVGYGAGQFGFGPSELARMRDRIFDPGDGAVLMAALGAAGKIGCTTGEPDLVRLPKEYEAEGRRGDLLRHKNMVARTFGTEAPPEVVTGAKAAEWIMDTTETLMPLIRWLHAM